VSEIEREIANQPECWRKAAELAPACAAALPVPGERVATVGCGTSWFVAQSYSALREGRGQGESDAFTPSEMPTGRPYDRIVVISRSGTTSEVLWLLRRLDGGTPTTAVTAAEGSPVAGLTTRSVALSFADERSVVQTRFATSALALLRAHLGDDLEPAIGQAGAAIGEPLPVEVSAFGQFVALGTGWTLGLAHEAALKMREAAGAWAESYPAMEYRHGPISVAGTRSLVWALADLDADLARDVRATGATLVEQDRDPMARLILVQRAAVALADANGLDPDRPRHLSRSVVLS